MRFNKQELITLAAQPSHKFDREGILILRERQDGFFRKVEVSQERWCRLRGNLLFYLRSSEQWSEPLGVIILEQCSVRIAPQDEPELWPFHIVWDTGPCYQMSAVSESERIGWLQAIQLATYECMRSQMLALQQRLEKRRGPDPDMDIYMWRIKRSQKFDINEVPLCELAMSCDNLLCDAHGRPPSSLLVIHVKVEAGVWIRYAATEVVERSSNPCFLSTVSFRASDGLNGDTLIKVTAYDMKERVTNTAVPIGSASILLSTIQDTQRLRITLSSRELTTVGFLTLHGWSLEAGSQCTSPKHKSSNDAQLNASNKVSTPQKVLSHRRSQSLPPKLGVKIKLPKYGAILKHLFANTHEVTYRFHSGLGGDITVHEIMSESRLCYDLPQQLLQIYIQREKELLQEVICLGELGGQWKSWQMELLDTHLSLLRYYSHKKQSLQVFSNASQGKFFKQSSRKGDSNLEFAPVNLHLQRMWVHNDTLNKSGFYDTTTVGAFTAHTHKTGKGGGLLKLLQQMKDIPPNNESSFSSASFTRVKMACDAVQAIKQLRGEVVDVMRKLLILAKEKQPDGMITLVEQMMSKTRVLLSLWDAGLVEEALAFIEVNKVSNTPTEDISDLSENGNKRPHMLSPFKRLTQQLNLLDLKSPDLDDFATPSDPQNTPKWPQTQANTNTINPNMPKVLHSFSAKGGDFKSLDNSVFKSSDNKRSHSSSKLSLGLQFYNNHFHDETSSSLTEYQSLNFIINRGKNENWLLKDNDSVETKKILPNSSARHQSDPSSMENIKSQSENAIAEKVNHISEPIQILNAKPLDKMKCDTVSEENGNKLSHTCDDKGNQWKSLSMDETVFDAICGADMVGRQFLDLKEMSNSPSANYYQPTDEPEPWDLTQLNIEASVMCLVSKVKFLCGRCGSPAVRLRGQRLGSSLSAQRSTPTATINQNNRSILGFIFPSSKEENDNSSDGKSKPALSSPSTALTLANSSKNVKKGNKFTDGLKLSDVSDWAVELRPPMRKLRQAMDGLLKGGRLAHAVLRLRCEPQQRRRAAAALQMRRDVCFSQALTAITSGLMCWLWSTDVDVVVKLLKAGLGPLCCFEGLLSLHGPEVAMWGDMVVAIEDLQNVLFALHNLDSCVPAMPQITGSRASLTVRIPVSETLFNQLSEKHTTSFTITAVFFNVGIDEKAGVAEALCETGPQERSNIDNFDRLSEYYHRYKKLTLPDCIGGPSRASSRLLPLGDVIESLRMVVHAKTPKNVEILQLVAHATRRMNGVKLTSCKSAKDRTGMSVTLEQSLILTNEYHLAEHEFDKALDCLRSEGCRRENSYKNVGVRKYAFHKLQRMALPKAYRPPPGTFGWIQT